MINTRLRFIFVHIPRTGGTSVATALNNHCPQSIVVDGVKHKSLSEYEKFVDDLPDYFVFTIVRNPWDRVVSLYQWKVDGTNKDTYVPGYLARLPETKVPILKSSFEDFVRNFEEQTSRADRHRYHEWLDVDREVEIIRFEDLSRGFYRVCKMLGMPQLDLPHIHYTSHLHYTSYYNCETKSLVEEYFREDLERYNYGFGHQ